MSETIVTSNTIEKQALRVGAVINFIMALAGWLAYYLSNSQALFLDGNFSFLMFISLFVAIKVSDVKAKKTELFPYGQFVYEALYSLLKGIMIIGVLLVTFIQNTSAIFHFISGGEAHLLNTKVIFIYSVSMVIFCFSSAIYYRFQNKKISNSSTILRAEYSSAIVDGFMSAGIGVALVSIRFVSLEGSFGFFHYIGDSLLVILLCLILGKGPIFLVRDSFIELAGGTLQDKSNRVHIEGILHKHLQQDNALTGSYISKTGSNYLIVAYLDTRCLETLGSGKIKQLKEQIRMELEESYPNIMFEVVLA